MSGIDRECLRRSLNSLCEFLDIEYKINGGGCCWIASEIARHLDELKIPYDLVIYDFKNKDSELISNEVRNMRKNRKSSHSVAGYNSCNHYCLYIHDCGIINGDYSGNRYLIKDINYKNISWIYKKSCWNHCYDTTNNKTIKKILNLFFRKYDKILEEELFT